ncbi:MAG: radical SAM protein [Phycisphaerales bacterium]|nr:radical SAM protein [Phycisphaerales bacterium]
MTSLTPILEPNILDATLRVNETFHSIQGESTFAGCPCFFIRLGGCPLRCHYCDTEYAFRESSPRTLGSLIEEARVVACPLIEVTGGEPLAQARAFELIRLLCDAAFTVLIETSGSIDIRPTDPRAVLIMDLKTPGSGECEKNLLANIEHLRPHDEVKFVLTSREDYLWAKAMMETHQLASRVRAVLMSPVAAQAEGREIKGCAALDPRALATWILADRLPVRQQTQLHKHIWEPQTRGV